MDAALKIHHEGHKGHEGVGGVLQALTRARSAPFICRGDPFSFELRFQVVTDNQNFAAGAPEPSSRSTGPFVTFVTFVVQYEPSAAHPPAA
jgi:hypothetical protein